MTHYKNFAATIKNKLVVLLAVLLFIALTTLISCSATAAPLTIASNGRSTFSIVMPKVAAQSVNDAAIEMQRDIKEATGVNLPIIKDDNPVNAPFISLGATRQAEQAGISAQGLEYDGYRIITQVGNLFVIGIDTTTETSQWGPTGPRKVILHPEIPGPAYTAQGGFSNGTANGVYSFLEEQLDVRWLFPGDLGRVVPSKSTFIIPELNTVVAPRFNYRIVSQARYHDAWWAHQKLNYAVHVEPVHSFQTIAPASTWKDHPEWFAMNAAGERPKPVSKNYKLETTNQELVKHTADMAINALKADPQLYSFSVSPSDGLGWSSSPESKALTLPTSPGLDYPYNVTPLVVKWYRDVTNAVTQKYPSGKVTGFLYSAYRTPPQDTKTKLPANFIPIFADNASGYLFFQKDVRELRRKMIMDWAKIVQGDWYYYGNMTWLRWEVGIVTPAAPQLINFAFQNMVDGGMKGGEVYGSRFWSQGALKDYILAQKMWQPTRDAYDIRNDWLDHAYGVDAAASMKTFYDKLDIWWDEYANGQHFAKSNLSEDVYRYLYKDHYPEMEKLFLEAWNSPMSERQKARLDLIRQNMVLLQFSLRNAGYLPANYNSPLTQNAKEIYAAIVADANNRTKSNELDFKIYENLLSIAKRDMGNDPVNVALSQTPPVKTNPFPNPDQIVLYSTKDQTVNIDPFDVSPGSSILFYYLHAVQKNKTNLIERGILSDGDKITFEAKADTAYYFRTYVKGFFKPQNDWKIRLPGAINAVGTYVKGTNTLYLSPEKSGSLYAFIPSDLPLQQIKEGADLIIQTGTNEHAKKRRLNENSAKADDALKDAYKKYHAEQVLDLNDKWRFTTDPKNIGDKEGYFNPDFNDSGWKQVTTLDSWQNQGFAQYYGTAWYRRTINLTAGQADPALLEGKRLLLHFGNIDGEAVIYFNGQKVAVHNPNDSPNGWEQPLVYDITDLVNYGNNNITVEVTKNRLASGLYRGANILKGVIPKG